MPIISNELREELVELLNEHFDDYYFEERMQAKAFFDDIRGHIEWLKRTNKRLDDIENMIHHHAIGVQNVYNEVMKMKEIYKLTIIDQKVIDNIQRIKQLSEILD